MKVIPSLKPKKNGCLEDDPASFLWKAQPRKGRSMFLFQGGVIRNLSSDSLPGCGFELCFIFSPILSMVVEMVPLKGGIGSI